MMDRLGVSKIKMKHLVLGILAVSWWEPGQHTPVTNQASPGTAMHSN